MAKKSTPAQVKADLTAAREATKKLRRFWKAMEIVQEEIARQREEASRRDEQ